MVAASSTPERQNEMIQVAYATSVFYEYAFIFFNSVITNYGGFPPRGPLTSVPSKDRFRGQSRPS